MYIYVYLDNSGHLNCNNNYPRIYIQYPDLSA